jgi:hypothetical protein
MEKHTRRLKLCFHVCIARSARFARSRLTGCSSSWTCACAHPRSRRSNRLNGFMTGPEAFAMSAALASHQLLRTILWIVLPDDLLFGGIRC